MVSGGSVLTLRRKRESPRASGRRTRASGSRQVSGRSEVPAPVIEFLGRRRLEPPGPDVEEARQDETRHPEEEPPGSDVVWQLLPTLSVGGVVGCEHDPVPVRRFAGGPAECTALDIDVRQPVAAALVQHRPGFAPTVSSVQQEPIVAGDPPVRLVGEEDGAERPLAGFLNVETIGNGRLRGRLLRRLVWGLLGSRPVIRRAANLRAFEPDDDPTRADRHSATVAQRSNSEEVVPDFGGHALQTASVSDSRVAVSTDDPERLRGIECDVCDDRQTLGPGGRHPVELPEPHRAILPARDDPVALRRERDAPDPTLMALEGRGRGRPVELPEPHRAIVPARDDPVALRRERDAPDPTLIALEGRGRGRAVELPEPRRAIAPARDDPVALRRDRDAPDPTLMALEGRGRGRAVEPPEPHRAILPARDDPVALRRERDAADGTLMALEGRGRGLRCQSRTCHVPPAVPRTRARGPHGHSPASRELPETDLQRVALRRERDAQDRTLMALEGRGRGRAVELPEPHRAIDPARDDPVALRREPDAPDSTLIARKCRVVLICLGIG